MGGRLGAGKGDRKFSLRELGSAWPEGWTMTTTDEWVGGNMCDVGSSKRASSISSERVSEKVEGGERLAFEFSPDKRGGVFYVTQSLFCYPAEIAYLISVMSVRIILMRPHIEIGKKDVVVS